MPIIVDHDPKGYISCQSCGSDHGSIEVTLYLGPYEDDIDFGLCDPCWEELVAKLQGKRAPNAADAMREFNAAVESLTDQVFTVDMTPPDAPANPTSPVFVICAACVEAIPEAEYFKHCAEAHGPHIAAVYVHDITDEVVPDGIEGVPTDRPLAVINPHAPIEHLRALGLLFKCPKCGNDDDIDNAGDGETLICMRGDCGHEWKPERLASGDNDLEE